MNVFLKEPVMTVYHVYISGVVVRAVRINGVLCDAVSRQPLNG